MRQLGERMGGYFRNGELIERVAYFVDRRCLYIRRLGNGFRAQEQSMTFSDEPFIANMILCLDVLSKALGQIFRCLVNTRCFIHRNPCHYTRSSEISRSVRFTLRPVSAWRTIGNISRGIT